MWSMLFYFGIECFQNILEKKIFSCCLHVTDFSVFNFVINFFQGVQSTDSQKNQTTEPRGVRAEGSAAQSNARSP